MDTDFTDSSEEVGECGGCTGFSIILIKITI